MKKEFKNNVLKLFRDVVTDSNSDCNADDVLSILLRKVTLPLKYWWEGDHLKLVYYNVSLDVESTLASFEISYNTDYVVRFENLRQYDAFQLAEFVLALERDIPQWKHLWTVAAELRKKSAKIKERLKNTLSEIRRNWITCNEKITHEQEDRYRIRFYNTKAAEMMLLNENPFWSNKKTEAEILEQCNTYHVEAPIEQWYDDWIAFVEACDTEKSERERKIQEQHDKLMKMRHLINIKQLKLEAFLKTIELHDSVCLEVDGRFDMDRLDATKYGDYFITLGIDNAQINFFIKYGQIDACVKKVTEYFKRINDLTPELFRALKEDGSNYSISSDRQFWCPTDNDVFYIEQYVKNDQDEDEADNSQSVAVVMKLNALCRELRNYIMQCPMAKAS